MKNMKKITSFMFFVVLLLSFQACYEDFKVDFDYTATYFARQFPLRTLVDTPGEEMSLEIGAVLGGKYSNDRNEEVVFAIQDSFLNADNFSQFTRLPDNYYNLESTTITIPSGTFVGSVKLTLDKEQFLNDPLATENTYALPVEIVSATSDSILDGKHYSVLVVKYINQFEGWYYVKGTDTNNDDPSSSVTYSNDDLVRNEDVEFSTINRNTALVPYVGNPAIADRVMTFTINADNTVTISEENPTGGTSNISGTGTYDPSTRNFTLNYTYTDGDGNSHTVVETLTYRNTELIFEEWQ